MRDAWHVTTNTVADRAKALRELLELTQDDVAAASGILRREEISKLESGKLKGTTARTREGLARGFGVPEKVLDDLLEGRITAKQAAEAVGGGEVAQPQRHIELDTRYASRAQYIALLGDTGEPHAVRALLIEELADGAKGDPGIEYWKGRYAALIRERTEIVANKASFGAALEDDDAPRLPPRISATRR